MTRVGTRCKYCLLPQSAYEATFHVDHLIASQHRCDDNRANVAVTMVMRYDSHGMIPLVEQHRPQIAELCRLYGVKRLELFGSAASGGFDSVHSDVDFFYELDPAVAGDLADRFFAFKERLEALLGCRVDLVSARHATNPYFLEEANRYRQTLYAA